MPQPKDDRGALTEGERLEQRRGEIATAFELADPSGGSCPHDFQWGGHLTGESWHSDLMRVCTLCELVDLTASGRPAPDWPPAPDVLR